MEWVSRKRLIEQLQLDMTWHKCCLLDCFEIESTTKNKEYVPFLYKEEEKLTNEIPQCFWDFYK